MQTSLGTRLMTMAMRCGWLWLDLLLEFDGNLLVRAFIPQKHYPDDVFFRCTERYANHNGDKCAATRRAIVRDAAGVGMAIP